MTSTGGHNSSPERNSVFLEPDPQVRSPIKKEHTNVFYDDKGPVSKGGANLPSQCCNAENQLLTLSTRAWTLYLYEFSLRV